MNAAENVISYVRKSPGVREELGSPYNIGVNTSPESTKPFPLPYLLDHVEHRSGEYRLNVNIRFKLTPPTAKEKDADLAEAAVCICVLRTSVGLNTEMEMQPAAPAATRRFQNGIIP